MEQRDFYAFMKLVCKCVIETIDKIIYGEFSDDFSDDFNS